MLAIFYCIFKHLIVTCEITLTIRESKNCSKYKYRYQKFVHLYSGLTLDLHKKEADDRENDFIPLAM